MGAGASSLPRLRKALLIKAYNARSTSQNGADLSLYEQFLPYAYQRDDKMYYINVVQIKTCLGLEMSKDYVWLDDLLIAMFRLNRENGESLTDKDIYLYDFVQFLETGKVPSYANQEDPKTNNTSNRNLPGPEARKRAGSTSTTNQPIGSTSPGRPSQKNNNPPPQPPRMNDSGAASSPRAQPQRLPTPRSRAESKADDKHETPEEEVIQINLSRVSSSALGGSIKIKTNGGDSKEPSPRGGSSVNQESEDTLEVIIRPNKQTLLGPNGSVNSLAAQGKQLWRKREVVRQEKTIHYTTVDEDGQHQELVEKETTQTEILHMECRDTGEFAHRELTQYEQLETFNDEVVNEVHGNEEYVHLKSVEDEFHYMESTMPPKEGPSESEREREGKFAEELPDGEGGPEGREGGPRYYYDPNEVPPEGGGGDGGSVCYDHLNEQEEGVHGEGGGGGYDDSELHYSASNPPTAMRGGERGGEKGGGGSAKDRSYLFEPASPELQRPVGNNGERQEGERVVMMGDMDVSEIAGNGGIGGMGLGTETDDGRDSTRRELNFSFESYQQDQERMKDIQQKVDEMPGFTLPSQSQPIIIAQEPEDDEDRKVGGFSRADSYQSMHEID